MTILIPPSYKKESSISNTVDMSRVATLIMGGGSGTRLHPLTITRCKPAISFGGKYRLIDVPISNTLNSGCNKIFVITQFLSATLHQHILKTYRLENFSNGFIEILSVEQKPSKKNWYEGTADCIRQNLEYLYEIPVDYFLILSGDQLYHMDFRKMVTFAKETDANMVIATIPADAHTAKRMGIMKVNKDHYIEDFIEKPKTQELLEPFKTSHQQYLGSMGIYLVKREALFEMLQNETGNDFGMHLIPSNVKKGKVAAYVHEGYWEDIGTIQSFYEANINLTKRQPYFSFHNENHPIFSHYTNLPGAKIHQTKIVDSIICEGSFVEASEIKNSIIGPRSVIGTGTVIHDSYLFGNDFYEPPVSTPRLPKQLHIGKNCLLRKCIIDKNVCIGNHVQLINSKDLEHFDGPNIFIRDGIIVVGRGAVIPDNFTL